MVDHSADYDVLAEAVKSLADYWARRSYVVCANCQSHADELHALLKDNPRLPVLDCTCDLGDGCSNPDCKGVPVPTVIAPAGGDQ